MSNSAIVKAGAGTLAAPKQTRAAVNILTTKAAANWRTEFPAAIVLEAVADLDPRDFPGGWLRLLQHETYPPVGATFRKYILEEQDARHEAEYQAREKQRREDERRVEEETEAERAEFKAARPIWLANPTTDIETAAERLRKVLWYERGASWSFGIEAGPTAVVIRGFHMSDPVGRRLVRDHLALLAPTVPLIIEEPDKEMKQ